MSKEGDFTAWVMPVLGREVLRVPVKDAEQGFAVVDGMALLLLHLQDNLQVMADHSNVAGVARLEADGEGGLGWFDIEEES